MKNVRTCPLCGNKLERDETLTKHLAEHDDVNMLAHHLANALTKLLNATHCDEHNKTKACPSCLARERGAKGGKKRAATSTEEQRRAWGAKATSTITEQHS